MSEPKNELVWTLRNVDRASPELLDQAADEIERLLARLTAAVRVLDAITDAEGNLSLPADDSGLRIAFEAAKEIP